MEKRSRLGRGLSSLLNLNEPEATGTQEDIVTAPIMREIPAGQESEESGKSGAVAEPEMLHVELSKIVPNANQPRKEFDPEALASLAESMRVAGVIQPILVRQTGEHFEVIAGERRWRAAKLAGLATMPVIVRQVDAIEQAQIALIENIHRQDLNPIERAMAYQQLTQQLGLTQAELATRLGEDRSSVGHFLRLMELPAKARDMVAGGALSVGHAKLLASIQDPVEIDRLAELVVSQGLSVRNLERLMKEGIVPAKPPTVKKLATPHIADLERRISRDLQMRAEVKQGARGGKGKLVLHYASLDQFDELLGRMGIKVDD